MHSNVHIWIYCIAAQNNVDFGISYIRARVLFFLLRLLSLLIDRGPM